MRIGFILTAYDRIDDLLAHIDILKFFPHEHTIIPVWMKKDVPDYFLEEICKHEHAHYADGVTFRIGPLLGLISGLRRAKEVGLDYVVYRNGDDWLFNHQFCLDNFNVLASGKKIAAYNWLTADTTFEFALNEMYLDVNAFMETADEAEKYFRSSNYKFLCELKMARWVKRTLNHDFGQFYRLPGREQWPGIGYEVETLPEVLKAVKQEITEDFWAGWKDNQRFFNRQWQLIGSHDNNQRYDYYRKIRNDISYRFVLETTPQFSRWLSCVRERGTWNLPSERANARRRRQQQVHVPTKMPKRLITTTGLRRPEG